MSKPRRRPQGEDAERDRVRKSMQTVRPLTQHQLLEALDEELDDYMEVVDVWPDDA